MTIFFIAAVIVAYLLPAALAQAQAQAQAQCPCGYVTDSGNLFQFSTITDFSTLSMSQFSASSDWKIISRLFPASNTHAYDLLYTPSNVNIANNNLQLTCSNCTGSCTSIASAQIETIRSDILFGSFRATFQVAGSSSGAIGAFFYYADDETEIDIEVRTADNPQLVHFTNQPVWTSQMNMPNGAVITSSNQYRFDWNTTGTYFYINDILSTTKYDGVPTINGSVYLSMWGNGGAFSGPTPPTSPIVMSVSQIQLYYNTSDPVLAASWAETCAASIKPNQCVVDGTSSNAIAVVPSPSVGTSSPTSTITQTSGSVGYTSTVPTVINGASQTVVVVNSPTPMGYVTQYITSGSHAATTVTVAIAGTASGTVQVIVPTPTPMGYVTQYITSGSHAATTVTVAIAGTASGTVQVIVPTPTPMGYVTQYITSGSHAATTVTVAIAGTASGTVQVIVPTPTPMGYVTQYITSGSQAATVTVAIAGTASGTVQVIVPTPTPMGYVTQYITSGSQAATVTAATAGTASGTVQVIVPTPTPMGYVTQYITSGSHAATTVTVATAGTASGTVQVIVPTPTPMGYVTQYITSGSHAATTVTVATAGTASGTVQVIVPTPTPMGYVTQYITSGSQAATTMTVATAGAASGTVQVIVPTMGYVTQYITSGSHAATTVTIATAGSASGTVQVIVPTPTPMGYVTQYITSGSQAATTVTIATAGTASGTVQVIVPTKGYVTQYITSGTQAATTVTIATAGAASGTVQVILPTPDLSCNNQGLQYSMYTNPYYNSNPPYYSSFQLTPFQTTKPMFIGNTTSVGILPNGLNGKNITVYSGSPSYPLAYLAVIHRGYLYAQSTGSYTFQSAYSDEIVLLWVGNNAYTNWVRSTASLEQDYISSGGTPQTLTVTLQQGTYNPIRLVWANAQGDGNFAFTVTAPNGENVINISGSNSKYLVQFACDGSTPAFAPFGSGG